MLPCGAISASVGPMAYASTRDGGGRSFLSNQALPSYAVPTTQNVGSDPFNNATNPPTTLPWDFGDVTTTQPGDTFAGHPAFGGNQFASRKLGDIVDDGNCCVNNADTTAFVRVLLGIDTNATDRFYADMNSDGKDDGQDIEPYIRQLFGNQPCP